MTLAVDGDVLDVQVQGMHKFWAMKSSLRIPLHDIKDIRHDPERAKRFIPGIKIPGTHIPFVYTAGTFYQSDFRPDFWSVRDASKALVIHCMPDAAYDELIVEVEDPAETLTRIRAALPRRA
ncbi:MAG: hypothetical protein KF709_04745 [Gemmatimonadaceae bacterium]|nr:hypothetical protein [Gemmatimonadaceae bacterium]